MITLENTRNACTVCLYCYPSMRLFSSASNAMEILAYYRQICYEITEENIFFLVSKPRYILLPYGPILLSFRQWAELNFVTMIRYPCTYIGNISNRFETFCYIICSWEDVIDIMVDSVLTITSLFFNNSHFFPWCVKSGLTASHNWGSFQHQSKVIVSWKTVS
jgi:hypothetical protein